MSEPEVTPLALPERRCTVCGLRGLTVPATFVASGDSGGQWFECDAHAADAHPFSKRVAIVSMRAWFAEFIDPRYGDSH